MSDFLDVLARVAQINIESEYYDNVSPIENVRVSLKRAILDCKANPVITEIKAASPSTGIIRTNIEPSSNCKSYGKRRSHSFIGVN